MATICSGNVVTIICNDSVSELRQFRKASSYFAPATKAVLLKVSHRFCKLRLWLLLVTPKILHVELFLLELSCVDSCVLLFDLTHSLFGYFLLSHATILFDKSVLQTTEVELFAPFYVLIKSQSISIMRSTSCTYSYYYFLARMRAFSFRFCSSRDSKMARYFYSCLALAYLE